MSDQPLAPVSLMDAGAARTGVCLYLSVPEWFQRADFLAWRRKVDGPAVFHREDRDPDASWLDVFMTFDNPTKMAEDDPDIAEYGGVYAWEGSNNDLPTDLYQAIGEYIYEHDYQNGIVKLSP